MEVRLEKKIIRKPRSHVRILMYRTWAITFAFLMVIFSPPRRRF